MKNIADDVILGKDVKIFDFVNLYGCTIGDNSKVGTFVEIQKGAVIGRNALGYAPSPLLIKETKPSSKVEGQTPCAST